MHSYYFLFALDVEVVKELLPLGDNLLTGILAIVGSCITYFLGRKRQRQEIENLQAEKKSIEAASGVTTAEAAQIISEAAAATVQPLTERIREQREDIKDLSNRLLDAKVETNLLMTTNARLRAENELMRRKFRLQGEQIPELPLEGDM